MVTFNILGCCVSRIPIGTLMKNRKDYDTGKCAVIDSIAYDCHFNSSIGLMNRSFVRKSFD